MKKIIYFLILISVLFFYFQNNTKVIIPDDAIRFRLIANSNSKIDQRTKLLIRKELDQKLFSLLENSTSKEETKTIIEENEDVIKEILNKYNIPYEINYGLNYFPEKEYNGVTYQDGNYESLVISLGEGQGDNWWCVMYPPLCLLESSKDEYSEVEYKSYIYEVFRKLTS